MAQLDVDHLQLVLKVSERCNIACTYCYFFFKSDQSYREHDAVLSAANVEDVGAFLQREIARHAIKRVTIALHGGEPLLMKRARFRALLESLTQACRTIRLDLTVQTNAMLIDDDWIELFGVFGVRVGVSLDGPPEANDRARIDKKGRGTHARSIAGLRQVVEAAREGRIPEPGILCVMDPGADPVAAYRHFVDDLGVRHLDFLFPDDDHDSFDRSRAGEFGAYLVKVFETRLRRGDKDVRIRVLDHLQFLLNRTPAARADDRAAQRRVKVATISSDATLGIDDIIRSVAPERFNAFRPVSRTSLEALFSGAEGHRLREAESRRPAACSDCLWRDVCGGGVHVIHRHSLARGFDNPSIYCEDIKIILGRMVQVMHAAGVSYDALLENLA
ncbi:MAG: radical SAM protein [Alphaproteobacteria bacterium]|nr:radical SAM protein [Alphaproteobacteria bacterium]